MNKNRKAIRRARRIRRTVLPVCLMALVAVISIGGTIAWLKASSGPITNTFSPSNISLTLEETGATAGAKSFPLLPGKDITDKDPKVDASADVAYYVFVKVTEGNWPTLLEKDGLTKKLSYAVEEDWLPLTDVELDDGESVYYQELAAGASLTDEAILVNNTIVVSDELTDGELEAMANAKPTLTFEAYAIQKAKSNSEDFTPAAAWALAAAQE